MDMVRLDPPEELTMPIGEAMFSQRATRRLDPDHPITDAQLKIILDAASKAPNGGNVQPARFLVIRDREAIQKFGKLYHEAWWAKRRDAYGWKGKEDIPEGSQYHLAALLADEMVNAPAVILAYSSASGVAAASTFPGVQNLLLSARALSGDPRPRGDPEIRQAVSRGLVGEAPRCLWLEGQGRHSRGLAVSSGGIARG